jgi:hypothetical protein
MILIGISAGKVLIGVLLISITLLILVIAYRKYLAHLGKGVPQQGNYCVLYSLEKDPAHGELEFYFTTEIPRQVIFEILSEDASLLETIADAEFGTGGHILRYDSRKLANGTYFYQLRTDNQKTMKKFAVSNPSVHA